VKEHSKVIRWGSLQFCEAIHPLLTKLQSSVKIGFMDDVTVLGDLHTFEDVLTIMESFIETGLRLNTDKCEIISEDFMEIDTLATLSDFVRVNKEDMTLLGALVLKGKAQDKAIQDKIDDLTRVVERLAHLQAHDALVILKNSLAIPKLLYLLRTSECAGNPWLRWFEASSTFLLLTSTMISGFKPHYPSEMEV